MSYWFFISKSFTVTCQDKQDDTDLTQKCRKAGELPDISMLDHLFVTEEGYYSFADEGFYGS